jgi:hypothetical protein
LEKLNLRFWGEESQKFASELDRGGAQELNMGPIFFSDKHIDDILGFSDRQFNVEYQYLQRQTINR